MKYVLNSLQHIYYPYMLNSFPIAIRYNIAEDNNVVTIIGDMMSYGFVTTGSS